jgi:hypothetical protein
MISAVLVAINAPHPADRAENIEALAGMLEFGDCIAVYNLDEFRGILDAYVPAPICLPSLPDAVA